MLARGRSFCQCSFCPFVNCKALSLDADSIPCLWCGCQFDRRTAQKVNAARSWCVDSWVSYQMPKSSSASIWIFSKDRCTCSEGLSNAWPLWRGPAWCSTSADVPSSEIFGHWHLGILLERDIRAEPRPVIWVVYSESMQLFCNRLSSFNVVIPWRARVTRVKFAHTCIQMQLSLFQALCAFQQETKQQSVFWLNALSSIPIPRAWEGNTHDSPGSDVNTHDWFHICPFTQLNRTCSKVVPTMPQVQQAWPYERSILSILSYAAIHIDIYRYRYRYTWYYTLSVLYMSHTRLYYSSSQSKREHSVRYTSLSSCQEACHSSGLEFLLKESDGN